MMADSTVLTSAIMVGLNRNINNRGQHNKCQHSGQHSRQPALFLYHATLTSLLHLIGLYPHHISSDDPTFFRSPSFSSTYAFSVFPGRNTILLRNEPRSFGLR